MYKVNSYSAHITNTEPGGMERDDKSCGLHTGPEVFCQSVTYIACCHCGKFNYISFDISSSVSVHSVKFYIISVLN